MKEESGVSPSAGGQKPEMQRRARSGSARRSLILLALALTYESTGWAQPAPATKTSVLLITVDTLRADRLGCYGAKRVETPAMDALAADGVRFGAAYAQVPITLPSHTVILSGMFPASTGVRDFTSSGIPPGVGLIAEAFKRQGYQTAAFVSAFVLDGSWGFSRGFDIYDDHFDARQFETRNPGSIERRADATVNRLLAWLKARPAGKPSFIWLHLFDPHSDYNPPEPFRTRYAGRLYDGEIAYADSQLARLVAALRRSGEYDRMLIALLADHGESLGEHGEDEHGFFVYIATTHVPFILKLPRGEGARRVVAQPVGTVDLAPTLLDLARVRDPISRQFQGASLSSLVAGKPQPAERPVYSESYYPYNSFGWAPLHSLITARFQYIEAPRPEIFELATDPEEERNLFEQRRADAEALRAQLQDVERRYTSNGGSSSRPPLSAETLEKLKSLGYLAYAAPAASKPEGNLVDPKDRIGTFNKILRAADQTRMKNYAEADRLLAEVAISEPHLYTIPFQRAKNLSEWGKLDRAVAEYKEALSENPTFDQALLGLARAYFYLGQDDESARALQGALALNPGNFRAHLALAKVYWRQNKLDMARTEAETAIRLRKNFGESHATRGIILAKQGRYREALPELSKGLSLGYRDAVTYDYLGIAHAQLGNLPEALRAYERGVELDPKYPAARLNLALQYKKLGQAERARAQFDIVCKLSAELCRQYAPQFAPKE